jgi:hypothetical protein
MALQEFISKFYDKGGPAFLNRFEVMIISPFEANQNIADDRFVSFKVVSVTLPGKNLRTTANENVYGPTYEMAQGLTYAETISMNFYLGATHFERTFFMNWMDMIVKPDSYNLEYYDNYKRSIDVYQLDKNNQKTAGIRLQDCYPKTIGAIEYAQESGEVGQISVDFVFKEHTHIDGNGRVVNEKYAPSVDLSARLRQRGRNMSVNGGLEVDPTAGPF